MIFLRMLLQLLRRAIYGVGFRPKWPSVFFSPTLSITHGWNDAFKEGKSPIEQALEIVDEDSTFAEGFDVAAEMLKDIRVCPICSADLVLGSKTRKYCPNQHGLVRISDNEQGLPVIVFEIARLA